MNLYKTHCIIECGFLHIPKTLGTGIPVCKTEFILDTMLCISCTISDIVEKGLSEPVILLYR